MRDEAERAREVVQRHFPGVDLKSVACRLRNGSICLRFAQWYSPGKTEADERWLRETSLRLANLIDPPN